MLFRRKKSLYLLKEFFLQSLVKVRNESKNGIYYRGVIVVELNSIHVFLFFCKNKVFVLNLQGMEKIIYISYGEK